MTSFNKVSGFIGLWIIEKISGIPVCSLCPDDTTQVDSVLFGGFMVAIRGMMNDLNIGELSSFSTKQSNLLIAASDDVFSVLAIEKDMNAETWYPTLLRIQQIVEEKYIQYRKDEIIINTTVFEKLKPDLRQLVVTNVNSFQKKMNLSGIDQVKQVVIDDKHETGDLEFLFHYFSEGLGKLVYTLLLEEPVLIIGDTKDLLQRIVTSIESLVPHRLLSKDYPAEYTDPVGKDLIICSTHVNFLKEYKDITKVDTNKRKITSLIKGAPSVDNLIYTLKITPIAQIDTVIHRYIGKLFAKTGELTELCQREMISKEDILKFRSDLKVDELNVVISKVRKGAPQFKEKLFYFARSYS
ncbi:MAG: hypothetical protein ACXADY_12410 [Candidatus Hodarchaeales archaeon]|jgi:hypothetical protein